MSNMDYFQPLDKHGKIQQEVGFLQKNIEVSWGWWLFWGLVFYYGPSVIYALDANDYKRDLHLNLGRGVVPECAHRDKWDDYECKQCPTELHNHYSKAWRKVK